MASRRRVYGNASATGDESGGQSSGGFLLRRLPGLPCVFFQIYRCRRSSWPRAAGVEQALQGGAPTLPIMTRSPVELVIFDCDGVLVDSERICVKVDAVIMADLGCTFTEEE